MCDIVCAIILIVREPEKSRYRVTDDDLLLGEPAANTSRYAYTRLLDFQRFMSIHNYQFHMLVFGF